MITVLGDMPLQWTELEETRDLLFGNEALANEAGSFLYLFFFSYEAKEGGISLALSDLLSKFELTNRKIEEHCITISKLPAGNTAPKTAVHSLFIVDSLLDDLKDIMNTEADMLTYVRGQIRTIYEELMLLRSMLNDIELQQSEEIEEVRKLVTRIRDVAYEAEYLINSSMAGNVPAWYLTLRLPDVIKKIKVSKMDLEEMKKNYGGVIKVAKDPSELRTSKAQHPTVDEIVVGFKDEAIEIAGQLVGGPQQLQIVSITGMPGLGKTTLAKKLYHNPSIVYHFDKRAWCSLSQTYQKREILIDILSLVSDLDNEKILKMQEESLVEGLYKTLKGRRYLIIMDDIWNIKAWEDLKRSFPDDGNGSRILFTSRIKDVALQASPTSLIHALPLLTVDQCWDLLQKKVFREECCPPELLDIGKQIAEHCQGLPLSVVVIASVLANMEKRKSLWQEVAGSLSSHISADPNKCMNILELSYKHLPYHLRPCFLYFGAFREDREIPVQKLIPLWIAEGFIRKEEHKRLEEVAEEYLLDLIDKSLVIVAKRRSDGGVKACVIHDLLRDLCLRLGKEENFLKVVEYQFSIHEQHQHLWIHPYSYPLHSSLFGLHIRSLSGVLHNPSLTFPRLKFLRVLDLLTMELEPSELKGIGLLVHLRYLAVSSVPFSVGSLPNLEFLHVKEIEGPMMDRVLKMGSLRHLRAVNPRLFGTYFLSQALEGSQMNNLQTISSVCIFYEHNEKILKCSSFLRKLKCVCTQLGDSAENFLRYPVLDFFTQLETLNVTFQGRVSMVCRPISFPLNLKKLTLSDFNLRLQEVSIIGRLPKLEVLKLRNVAFEGNRWDTKEGEFEKLRFLKLDRLQIAEWFASSDHFPRLQRLVLRKCENLEEIPCSVGDISTLQMIEVELCGESVVESAEKIQEEQMDMGNEELKVIITH
ncbi:hypothetical protein Pfo_031541 [Paulownia fortunei]|nr:hypothetical protein Pfo_031541 [Paulownia fortunei]